MPDQQAIAMRIILNGEPRDLVGPLSVEALLDQLGLDGRTVAVELNRQVVKRVQYGTTLVEDASEVEIVAFVGGGSGRGSELS
jgi:sulfur carrier protein